MPLPQDEAKPTPYTSEAMRIIAALDSVPSWRIDHGKLAATADLLEVAENSRSLREPPRFFRAGIARGIKAKDAVIRDGGDYGAGLIKGAAVITRGPALGHDMWIDAVMLKQVVKAINAEPTGSKSRFAHPTMSGDGLGKVLGRYRDADMDGNIVRADLHMMESAHKTPDGDLAGYVMDLAEEDPLAFGNSIAFSPDLGAEELFRAKHTDKDGRFKSPDEDNASNFTHARLAELVAVDAVDEPAANPGGLFHRGHEIALEADAAIAYALGLTNEMPDPLAFGVHPDRVRSAVQRVLERCRACILTTENLIDLRRAEERSRARVKELSEKLRQRI